MILAITEQNAWENESWTYVLDVEKQDASSLNFMMIFVRLANIQFEVDRENAKKNGHPRNFASSRYSFNFYDSYSTEDYPDRRTRILLTHKNVNMVASTKPDGYNVGGIMLDRVISNAKVKSAMIGMRDKKENRIYKDFESIFLKKKK